MRFLGLGKKKDDGKKAHGPQLAEYQSPFPMTGEIVEDEGTLYVTPSQADFLKFRNMMDTMDGFTLRVAKDNSLVWDKRVKGEPMVVIKAFTTIDCPPAVLWDVLHDPLYRIEWDDARLEGYLVTQLTPNCDIGYYGAKAQKPVYNRDFLNQRAWYSAGDGEYVIMSTSVPHARCPDQKGFVRAVSKISGYLVRPWGNGCSLTYISNADPKGWIPTTFVNMLVSKFSPAMLEKIRKAAIGWESWKNTQPSWKRLWEQEPRPWPEPQKSDTHTYFQDRIAGGAPPPVEELVDASPAASPSELDREEEEPMPSTA